MDARAVRQTLAAAAIATTLAVGAVAGAVDLARIALWFGAADRASAWTADSRERVRRVMHDLTPAVETVRGEVPESASVWCWSTTAHQGVYHLFLYLQTLLYPRDVWRPASIGEMTHPAAIPRDAAFGSACVVLHVPGDEAERAAP